MAISVIQHKFTAEVAASSTTCVFSSTVTAGSLLWAGVSTYLNAAATVSDNINGSWTQAVTQAAASNSGRSHIFYFPNSGAGTITVSASASGALDICITIMEISGILAASPLDTTAVNTISTTTTPVSGAFTTVAANEIITVYGANQNNNVTYAAGTGYTLADTSLGGGSGQGSQYKIVSSTQSGVTAGFTTSGSAPTNLVVATFKASSTTFTQTLTAGTASFSGVTSKGTSHLTSAAMSSFSGATAKATSHTLTAAMASWTGVISRGMSHALNAAMASFAGSTTRLTGKSLTAGLAPFSGSIGKFTGKAFNAAMASWTVVLSPFFPTPPGSPFTQVPRAHFPTPIFNRIRSSFPRIDTRGKK